MPQQRLIPLIALVDLDGTLCDCSAAIREGLVELRSPNEAAEDELEPDSAPHILARRRLIMSTAGFWRNLQPIPAGLQLVNLLIELEFDTYVFTKGPSDNSNAWAEKFEWCRHHVPALKVIVSEDKSLVHGDVLIEDWPPYVTQWLRRCPNGLVIIPAQPWNADPKALPENSIRYVGTNLREVRALLESLRKG